MSSVNKVVSVHVSVHVLLRYYITS